MCDRHKECISMRMNQKHPVKKILILGRKNVGKTAIRSKIFPGLSTKKIFFGAECSVQYSNGQFLGNPIEIWEFDGQEVIKEKHFASDLGIIFSTVDIMVYVFDSVINFENDQYNIPNEDLDHYQSCLSAIHEHSPYARLYWLLNKIDMVQENMKRMIFCFHKEQVDKMSIRVRCFITSSFDESLYEVWSKIIYQMVPIFIDLEQNLKHLATILNCKEVILYEYSTFLPLSYIRQQEHPKLAYRDDSMRNVEKKCATIIRSADKCAEFKSVQIKNAKYSALVQKFTSDTYIAVITSDLSNHLTLIKKNLKIAEVHFRGIMESNHPDQAKFNLQVVDAAKSPRSCQIL